MSSSWRSTSASSVQAIPMKDKRYWFVYMLLCDKKIFYIGLTNDLISRIQAHKNKDSFFTKKFSAITLVYCEKYLNQHQAALRERQLKGWSRAKKQMLTDGKLGKNSCTEFAEALGRG
jgi:putative endonuclease